MARMRPEDRRQTIIDAAHRVALRRGMSATTVRDVADEMGTSSGLIHHYFETMDELLATVFAEVANADLSATRERMDRFESAVDRLAAYLSGFTDPDNDATFQFWLDAWAEASRNESIRQTSRELNLKWHQILAEVISDGIASGEFAEVDADVVAWKALSLSDGLSLQVVAHRAIIPRYTAAEWAANSIEQDLELSVGTLSTSPTV